MPESFHNEPVPESALPDLDEVPLQAMAPNYRAYLLLSQSGLLAAFGGLASVAANWLWSGWLAHLVVIVVILWVVWTLALSWLDPRYRGWAAREHDILHQEGVLWRTRAVLPLARIQHVETTSGPLERLFGLMSLQCYSAGGSGADLQIPGLRPQTALRIRNHVLARIEETGVAEPTGAVDE